MLSFGIYTYKVLVAYVIYSGVLYAAQLMRNNGDHIWFLMQRPFQHWIDIAWYTLLIALSGGTNSFFFLFYFFAIIIAAFQCGFPIGLSATVVSTLLFSVVGYFTIPTSAEFSLDRFLLEPTYLLIIGYTIASLGGSELTLRRQLFLLKDVNSLSNPRFGIDRMLGALQTTLTFKDVTSIAATTHNDGVLDRIRITTPFGNTAPVAKNANATTDEDTSATGTLSAQDADSSNLTYSKVAGPAHGTAHSECQRHLHLHARRQLQRQRQLHLPGDG